MCLPPFGCYRSPSPFTSLTQDGVFHLVFFLLRLTAQTLDTRNRKRSDAVNAKISEVINSTKKIISSETIWFRLTSWICELPYSCAPPPRPNPGLRHFHVSAVRLSALTACVVKNFRSGLDTRCALRIARHGAAIWAVTRWGVPATAMASGVEGSPEVCCGEKLSCKEFLGTVGGHNCSGGSPLAS